MPIVPETPEQSPTPTRRRRATPVAYVPTEALSIPAPEKPKPKRRRTSGAKRKGPKSVVIRDLFGTAEHDYAEDAKIGKVAVSRWNDGENLPSNPADRIEYLMQISPRLAEDFAVEALNRLMMARMPLDQAAQTLGLSVSYAQHLRGILKDRIEKEAKSLPIYSILGAMIDECREAAAIGWRDVQASTSREQTADGVRIVSDWRRRRSGIEIAMKAQDRMLRLLTISGAMDGRPLRSSIATDGSDNKSVNAMRLLAENFLSGAYDDPGDIDDQGV